MKSQYPLPAFFKALTDVMNDQRSLILVTNGYFEVLADILLERYCKNSKRIFKDGRSYPYSVKLVILNEVGGIDDDLYRQLDAFRQLRNRAAHDAFFSISEDDYSSILTINGEKTSNLYELCCILSAVYWFTRKDIFTTATEHKSNGA